MGLGGWLLHNDVSQPRKSQQFKLKGSFISSTGINYKGWYSCEYGSSNGYKTSNKYSCPALMSDVLLLSQVFGTFED
ncbi:hypothetical protein YC2023_113396 [Brassica napus]